MNAIKENNHKQFDPTISWETFQNWCFLSTDYEFNMEIFGHPPRRVTAYREDRGVVLEQENRTEPIRPRRGRHLVWKLKNYTGSLFN